MSREFFQVAYTGEEFADGSMDVYELAPALLALGELVKVSNDILNGESAKSSLRVESEFKTGSFEISLVVDQSLIETAKTLFGGGGALDATHLVEAIFGTVTAATGMIIGILKVYKVLKGEKGRKIVHDSSTNTTIIVKGDGNTVNVDTNSAAV